MSLKSDDNQPKEGVYQHFLKELGENSKQIKQMEEKALKMKVECALKAIQMSTKVDTNESLNASIECHRMANQIESNLQTKPNPNIKPIVVKEEETNG